MKAKREFTKDDAKKMAEWLKQHQITSKIDDELYRESQKVKDVQNNN